MGSSALHPNSLDERYRPVFWDTWDASMAELPLITQQRNTTKQVERGSEIIAGVATVPVVAEGGEITRFTPQQGNEYSFTQRTYKLGFSITEEFREDDLWNQVSDYFRIQAAIMANTVKSTLYNHYNRAFDSAYPMSYNSTEMCSTAQPLAGGGTTSNHIATNADMTETSVEALVQLLVDSTNADGVYVAQTPSKLLHASANWGQGRRLTQSTTTTLQGTGASGNAINALGAYNIVPHFSPYLSDANAFFVMADEAPVVLYWRIPLTKYEPTVDPDTRAWNYDVRARWISGPLTWRTIAGSPGA